MKNSTNHWLQAAKDDLSVIDSIISNVDLTHIVAFHAQQAIEKCLKAVCEEHNIQIPRIHKLDYLYGQTREFLNIKIENQILNDLDALYIDSRYPGNFGLMPYGKPSIEDSIKYRSAAKVLYDYLMASI
jgi:HEPN domain-containing protein